MTARTKLRDDVVSAAIDVMKARKEYGDNVVFFAGSTIDELCDAVVAYCNAELSKPSRTRTVHDAPETSHEAGEWMKQFALSDAYNVFRRIYFVWRRFYKAYAANHEEDPREGLTCDEVEVEMERTHQSISARVNELKNGGWIEDSGERRETRSGAKAIVWTPTEAAKALVDEAGLPIPVPAWKKEELRQ